MMYGRKSSFLETTVIGAVVVALALLVGFLIAGGVAVISGTIFWICWNHGITHLVTDCGGTVSDVSWWTAFFTAWFVALVGGMVKGTQVNAKVKE